MKNLVFIFLLLWLFPSCNEILEDPDDVRVGIVIDEGLMTSQIWEVEYFSNGPQSPSIGFQEVFFEFNTGNTFDLINGGSRVFTGQWALSNEKDLLVIRSDGKIPAPYSEVENEWVILNADSNNIRILERNPKGAEELDFSPAHAREIPNVCEDITNMMGGKEWHIQELLTGGNVGAQDYESFEFAFETGSIAIAKAGAVELEGSWNTGISCNKFHFGFDQYAELKGISGLWQLSYFTENTIKLVMDKGQQNWEMKLVAGPNFSNNLCDEARSVIKGGSWTISKFVAGNDSYDSGFSQYLFQFKEEGKLLAFSNDAEFTGTWSLFGGCEKMSFDIDEDTVLDKINGEWQLVLVSSELIKLIAEAENNKKEVQFSRDPSSIGLCDLLDGLFDQGHTWHVSSYKVNKEDLTGKLKGINILFGANGALTINSDDVKTSGAWEMGEECKKIEIEVVEGNDVVNNLALDWYISEASKEQITLVYEGETELIELQLTT